MLRGNMREAVSRTIRHDTPLSSGRHMLGEKDLPCNLENTNKYEERLPARPGTRFKVFPSVTKTWPSYQSVKARINENFPTTVVLLSPLHLLGLALHLDLSSWLQM